jgi:DNA polymerase-3 subunit beta
VIAEKASLLAALKAVLPVTRGSKTIPILNHVVFARAGDRLVIRGSNLDQELNVAIKVAFGDDFQDIAVPAATLAQFVEYAPGTEIRLALDRTGDQVTSVSLSSGKSRLRLLTLRAEDFPQLETGPLDHGFTIDGQILAKALKAVIYAAEGENVNRMFLWGALLEPTDKGLAVIATDGKRLEHRLIASMAFDDDATLRAVPRTILPTSAVNMLLKLIVDGQDVTLQMSADKIRATVGNVTMLAKLIDATYPEWRRALPEPSDISVTLSTAALDAALTRVMLATDKKKDVVFRFSPGRLALAARDAGTGDSQDEIDVEGEAEIAIGFNGDEMRELLSHSGAERIEVTLASLVNEPIKKMAMVRHPDDPDQLSLLGAIPIWGEPAP